MMTLLEAAKAAGWALWPFRSWAGVEQIFNDLNEAIAAEEARQDRILEGAMAAEAERRVNAELSSPSADVVLTDENQTSGDQP